MLRHLLFQSRHHRPALSALAARGIGFLGKDGANTWDVSRVREWTRRTHDRAAASSSNPVTATPLHLWKNPILEEERIKTVSYEVSRAVVELTVNRVIEGVHCQTVATGIIVSSDGTVLTYASFLIVDEDSMYGDLPKEAARQDKVYATFKDGQIYEAKVVYLDFESDIAVVKISTSARLPVAKLGSSSELRPGDKVLSAGNKWFSSQTNVVVPCTIRHIGCNCSYVGSEGIFRDHLHTDFEVKPGYTKDFLINLDGEIVGLHTKDRDASDLSSALVIDCVTELVKQSKEQRVDVRPVLVRDPPYKTGLDASIACNL